MDDQLKKASERVIRSKKLAKPDYMAVPSAAQLVEVEMILDFADSPLFPKFEAIANMEIATHMNEAFGLVSRGEFNLLPLAVMRAQAYVGIFEKIQTARSIRNKSEKLKAEENAK